MAMLQRLPRLTSYLPLKTSPCALKLRLFSTSQYLPAPPPGWPGTQETYDKAQKRGLEWAKEGGYDVESLVESVVQWGDMDSFRHVNNAIYLKYIESGRINFCASLMAAAARMADADENQARANLVNGTGVGVILAEVSVRYRRPITFPDTVLVAHRVKAGSITPKRFDLEAVIWSYTQETMVTMSNSDIRWYDHTKRQVAECGPELLKALTARQPTT